MKKIFFALSLLASGAAFAQAPEESRDAENGSKVLKGFIPKATLATDTAFAWYPSGLGSFTPDAATVGVLKARKDSLHFLVFGGTWCDDTKQVLPKLFGTLAAAGVPDERITLLGTDREKKTVQHLSEAFNVTLVPTIIVLRNGKEVGRVVEYGSTGRPEREIGKIVTEAFRK